MSGAPLLPQARTALPSGAQVDAASAAEQQRLIESVQTSGLEALRASVSEGLAKGVSSLAALGLVQNYSSVVAQALLDHVGVESPVLRAVAAAALQAAPMGAAHYAMETMVRPAVLTLLGMALEKTNLEELVPGLDPEAVALRARLAKLQAATRLGQPIGDTLALAGFMLFHGLRGATLGQTGPLVTSLFSFLAGFAGVAAQTYAGSKLTADGVPAFQVNTLNPADALAAAKRGFQASQRVTNDEGDIVRGDGPVGNVLQDLFLRVVGTFSGLLLKTASTSFVPNNTRAQTAFNDALGSLAFLGFAFFATLGLLTSLRGKATEPGDALRRGLHELDPARAIGSTAAVVGRNHGPIVMGLAGWLDLLHHELKTTQTALPRAAWDGQRLVTRGASTVVSQGAGAFRDLGELLQRGHRLVVSQWTGAGPGNGDVNRPASRDAPSSTELEELVIIPRRGSAAIQLSATMAAHAHVHFPSSADAQQFAGAPTSQATPSGRFPAPFDEEATRRTLNNAPTAQSRTPETLHIRRLQGTTDASTRSATARQDRPKGSVDLGTRLFWDSSDDEQPDESRGPGEKSGWLTSDDE